jgi:lysophospholipase L1-like esterase
MKKPLLILLALAPLLWPLTALAENTAIVPEPRTFPTNWMARHEALVQQARRGGVDLLFLGDSITEGWHWDTGGLKLWKSRYEPRRAANFGIGWDRTQNVLWRITHGELDGLKPKVTVLLIGTNNTGNEDDGKPRNTTPEIIEGVAAIVRELRARLPETRVLLCGIFPRGTKDDPIRAQVRDVNAGLARLADGKAVKFLDLGAKLLEPDGTLSKDVMPDLLHLSEKGYRIWSDTLEEALAGMLK